jgi:hypothetical protein
MFNDGEKYYIANFTNLWARRLGSMEFRCPVDGDTARYCTAWAEFLVSS